MRRTLTVFYSSTLNTDANQAQTTDAQLEDALLRIPHYPELHTCPSPNNKINFLFKTRNTEHARELSMAGLIITDVHAIQTLNSESKLQDRNRGLRLAELG